MASTRTTMRATPQEPVLCRALCSAWPGAAGWRGTAELADQIEGVAGEWSSFEELHGFSIDVVSLSTAALRVRWRNRLVKVQNANTAAIAGAPRFTGWCLEPHDLCVAKLVALREKDANFVAALLRAGLVDSSVIAARLDLLDPAHTPAAERARSWLA